MNLSIVNEPFSMIEIVRANLGTEFQLKGF